MGLLRATLSAFALANAAFWAILAAAWSWRRDWPARLSVRFGTPVRHTRYLKGAPAWARLSAAMAGFWIAAAGLYVVGDPSANRAAVIVLFVIASIFLIIGIVAGGLVFRTLGFGDESSPAAPGREQSL